MPSNVELSMPLPPNTTKQQKYPTNIPCTFEIHSLPLEYGHVTKDHNSPEEWGSLKNEAAWKVQGLLPSSLVALFPELSSDEH